MRKLFVIGDSISLYYHEPLKCQLKGILEYSRKGNDEEINNALNVPNEPRGANAGDSFQVLDYISTLKDKNIKLDIVAINCGLHDIRRDRENNNLQVEYEDYKKNLVKIVTILREISNKIYWIRTTHVKDERHNLRKGGYLRYNKDVIEINKIADEIMNKEKIDIIDLYSFTKSLEKEFSEEEMYLDYIHFKEAVSQKQAEFIVKNIKEID